SQTCNIPSAVSSTRWAIANSPGPPPRRPNRNLKLPSESYTRTSAALPKATAIRRDPSRVTSDIEWNSYSGVPIASPITSKGSGATRHADSGVFQAGLKFSTMRMCALSRTATSPLEVIGGLQAVVAAASATEANAVLPRADPAGARAPLIGAGVETVGCNNPEAMPTPRARKLYVADHHMHSRSLLPRTRNSRPTKDRSDRLGSIPLRAHILRPQDGESQARLRTAGLR